MQQPLLGENREHATEAAFSPSAAAPATQEQGPADIGASIVVTTISSPPANVPASQRDVATMRRRRRTRYRSVSRSIRRACNFCLMAGLTASQARAARSVVPSASRTIHWLKVNVLLAFTCLQISVILQLGCAIEATRLQAPVGHIDKSCLPLESWLSYVKFFAGVVCRQLIFCSIGCVVCLPLCVPLCVGVIYIINFGLVVIVSSVVQAKHPECREHAREIWDFMERSQALNIVALTLQVWISPVAILIASRLRSRVLVLAKRGWTPQDVLARFPILPASGVDTSTECPVCLASWHDSSSWMELPCRHLFHKTCIKRWLRRSCLCPVCRQDVKALRL
eukprot:TRINITY_DN61699_c0_g1_i1.p1 TRINITY_DN61699_c0_g1~~TRINITY_DN61699_c0_g1_i1.p1  ORF type:complete len:338 (-),score=23.68 TRINITY_DN61699_c0_g1_i1:34-1047(-)